MVIPVHAAAADLTVESVSLSNPSPSVGQKVKIIFTIRNAGDAKSQPFYTSVSIDGGFFYEQSHGDIHEGVSVTESTKFWEYNGGSHFVTVCTDSRNNNSEPNESNCKTISVGGPTPKVATTTDISVCPAFGSGYDCTASLTAGSNTQVRIEGMLKRSDTQEGLAGRLVQISWPGGATVVTTSSTGGYSYTASVSFSSSASFVASFGGDSGYESSSGTKTVGVSSPPPPPPPPVNEICNNGIDDDGDGYVDEGCYVPPPVEPDISIRLRSDAEDGSKDLGQIIFDGSYYTLPTTIYKKPGTYSIQAVPYSGYVFKQWDAVTPSSSKSSPSTTVSVSGSSVIVEMELRKEPTQGTFHFSVASSPSYRQVKSGETTSFSIPVTLTSGPSQSVSLSVSGLPSNVGTASLSQTYGNPSFTPTLTINTYSSASPGTYYVTVSGSGGGESQQATVKIEIFSTGSSGTTPGGTQAGTTTGTTPGTTQPGTTQQDTSPKSSTSMGSFAVAQREYQLSRYESTEVKMNGNINDYNRGKPIDLAVRKPDGSTQNITIYATRDGLIMTSILLDKYSPIGIYKIDARYGSSLLGSVSFNVKSPEEVIVQPTFNFDIRLNQNSLKLKNGESADIMINTVTTKGKDEIISLSCTTTAKVICTIEPKNIRSGQSSSVKITAKEQGDFSVKIVGTYATQNGNTIKRDVKLPVSVASVGSTESTPNTVLSSGLVVDHKSFLPEALLLGGNKIVARLDYKNDMDGDVKFQLILEDSAGKKRVYSSHPLFGESLGKARTSGTVHFLSDELPRNSPSMKVYWQAYSYSGNRMGSLLDQSTDSEKMSFGTFTGRGQISMKVEKHGSISKEAFDFGNNDGFFAYKYPVSPRESNSFTVSYNQDVPFVITPFFAPSLEQNVYIFIPNSIEVSDHYVSGAEIGRKHSTNHNNIPGMWYELKIPAKVCESKTCTTISGGVSFMIKNQDSGTSSILVQTADFGEVISDNVLDEIVSSLWEYWASKMLGKSWVPDPQSVALFATSVGVDYLNSRQILVLDAGNSQKTELKETITSPPVNTKSDQPRPAGVSNIDIKTPKTVQPNKKATITVSGYYNPGIGGGPSYPQMKVTGTLYEKDNGFDDDSAGQCTSPAYTIEAHPPIGFPQDTKFECKFTATPSTFVKEFLEGKETEWFAKIRVKVDNGFDKSFETKTVSINCPKCK